MILWNILSLKKCLMKPSSHFESKSNFRRKVTSFVVSYITNITLPNASKNILMINLKDLLPQTNQYIMGDFNINLLHAETFCYAQDFLLSLQSFSFIPTIDKPTRVYNTSATLIDNIVTNKVVVENTSGYLWQKLSLFTILYFWQFYSEAKTRKAKLFWLF